MATLTQMAAAMGIALNEAHEAQFARYAEVLAAWNAHTNLTAITARADVEVKHFLDSLSIASAVPLPPGARLIDVGTGAGFPGVPLKLIYPDLHVTLLEATGKKIAFLKHLIEVLALQGVETVHARAEEAGQMPAHRAAYEVVAARAVARLPILMEYLLPLAKVGGHCIAMKGRTAQAEADDSANALQVLGGRLHPIQTVTLPGVDEPHHLVIVEKIAPTPAAYPRKPGLPTAKPL